MKRRLFVLNVAVWDADTYFNQRNCNPLTSDRYLFATREEAEQQAQNLDKDDRYYNEAFLYEGELEEDIILRLTGYETIEEFDEALSEPYSDSPMKKNYGENEKERVACEIMEDPISEDCIECANYDFGNSIDGSIVVVWSWKQYIGYARKCEEVRYAYYGETEADLAKRDKTFVPQIDVVMTKEEVEASADIKSELRERLLAGKDWKWTNPSFVEEQIQDI